MRRYFNQIISFYNLIFQIIRINNIFKLIISDIETHIQNQIL